MSGYNYEKNPYDRHSQKKEWTRWRQELRAKVDLESGKITSMSSIALAIESFKNNTNRGT